MPLRHEPPRGRFALRVLVLAGALGGAAWVALGSGGARNELAEPPRRAASGAAPAATPAPPPPIAPAIPPPPAAPTVPRPERIALRGPITALDPETRAALEARLARERAAQERFQQGIERSQMRSRDIDARVRDAFQRIELEPELLEGGLIRGLRIRSVEGGSAFGEAGFRPGDVLVELDGRALEDPAELPDILGRMGPRPSICARRGPEQFCRELTLR